MADLHEWVAAGDLQRGQWLRTSAGTFVQITAVRSWSQHKDVYVCRVFEVNSHGVATPRYKLRKKGPDVGAEDEGAHLTNRQALGEETERRRSAVAGAPNRAKDMANAWPQADGAADGIGGVVVAGITGVRLWQKMKQWWKNR
ncbi:hypothetical protein [Streptomyces sp. CC219B]|uniref:hypothetical protein n=1 Tax=Streptomyces sp. CC219B TaxID=3044574 RepID=UPI0024A9C956|nr:hypothetical protein [Streptomyces sp. CC219B]